LILWPTYAVAYREHFRDLTTGAIPVGVIDHTYSTDVLTDVVEADDRKGAVAVANYLLKKGHRRIACLSTREIEAQTWAVRRREAFEAAIDHEKNAECRSWRLNSAGDNGLAVAIELLSSKFAPTAVFCVSDHEAKFVYLAADRLEMSIPEDISVIGFNDLDFSEMLHPTLTTMHLDAEVMGRHVANMVLARLDKPTQDLSVVKVEATLVERQSVAAPKRSS
jgi:LacI family transcriptional regulator